MPDIYEKFNPIPYGDAHQYMEVDLAISLQALYTGFDRTNFLTLMTISQSYIHRYINWTKKIC
jgi:hypothetical protein